MGNTFTKEKPEWRLITYREEYPRGERVVSVITHQTPAEWIRFYLDEQMPDYPKVAIYSVVELGQHKPEPYLV